MTAAGFPDCLTFTLQQEGGFVDNADDPGGATNQGITLRTLQSFEHGATVDTLRHITYGMTSMIYHRDFWAVMACDGLPIGVDLMVFDFGVNAGPSRSIGFLQITAGVRRDGIDGAITQAAVGKMSATGVVTTLAGLQRAYYRALPEFGNFGEGWMARTDRRIKAAIELLPTTRQT
jgi:lysozyme family protein